MYFYYIHTVSYRHIQDRLPYNMSRVKRKQMMMMMLKKRNLVSGTLAVVIHRLQLEVPQARMLL